MRGGIAHFFSESQKNNIAILFRIFLLLFERRGEVCMESIDVKVNAGDTIRVFGRVTKGKDITVHILSELYKTPDTYHLDKAYFTKEKAGEIEIEYHCTKTEPLLIIFDNE